MNLKYFYCPFINNDNLILCWFGFELFLVVCKCGCVDNET